MDKKQILLINWVLETCKLIEYNVSYYISLSQGLTQLTEQQYDPPAAAASAHPSVQLSENLPLLLNEHPAVLSRCALVPGGTSGSLRNVKCSSLQ